MGGTRSSWLKAELLSKCCQQMKALVVWDHTHRSLHYRDRRCVSINLDISNRKYTKWINVNFGWVGGGPSIQKSFYSLIFWAIQKSHISQKCNRNCFLWGGHLQVTWGSQSITWHEAVWVVVMEINMPKFWKSIINILEWHNARGENACFVTLHLSVETLSFGSCVNP